MIQRILIAIEFLASVSFCNAQQSPQLRYFSPPAEVEKAIATCDIAVYGGSSAGSIAAIQAARMGHKVTLLSFNGYVGGLTSGGLTATDLGKKSTIGGLAREFYQRVGGLRDFRSTSAEKLYHDMMKDAGVKVILHQPLESVRMDGSRMVSVTMMTGLTVNAQMFIDATYEGDLMAAAKVSYQVGREPRSAFDESLAGQWQEISWQGVYQFCDLPISPYKTPGKPESGLLPGISPHPHGAPGDGDYRVQAYNFRMILSDKADRIPFPRPVGYDPSRYALLARFLNFDAAVVWTLNYTTKAMTDGPVQMRNGDSNNAGSFSSDLIDGSHAWPDGTFQPINFAKSLSPRRGLPVPLPQLYQKREVIFQDHVTYQQGLMFFLAKDAQVPADLRERAGRFGLDPNEFKTTGHWPHQLYVREGRRMVSDYIMTQADCEGRKVAQDSVGLASYPMDSHFCQRVAVERNGVMTVRNEGGFGHSCKGPYPVSFRSITPKPSECTNLLVPVSLSASHVAFGSIRMEPVFMILGQSAGTAASLAIRQQLPLQQIPYSTLRERLLADGQILTNQ